MEKEYILGNVYEFHGYKNWNEMKNKFIEMQKNFQKRKSVVPDFDLWSVGAFGLSDIHGFPNMMTKRLGRLAVER